MKTFKELLEKKLTPAELKKREEIAKAMERENPDMEMGKKMAIATAAAKRVAEEAELDEAKGALTYTPKATKYAVIPDSKKEFVKHFNTKAEAETHAQKHGGKVRPVDQYGRSMRSEEVELDEVNAMNRTSPVKRSNYVHSDKSKTPGVDGSTHNVVDASGKVVASYKNKMQAIDHANKKDEYRVKTVSEAAIKVGDNVVWGKGKTGQTAGKVHRVEDDDYILHHTNTNTYHRVPKQGTELAESVELDETPNEGIEMLSFKYFQELLDEAKKKSYKESEIENAHGTEEIEDEKELDEVSTATMSHQGKTTLKHVKNPGVQLRMAAHDIKPGIKGYRDRVALMKAADAEKKLKEDAEEIEHGEVKYRIVYRKSFEKVEGGKSFASKADAQKYVANNPEYSVQAYRVKQGVAEEVELDEVSPFDWKAYGKEKAKSATTSGTTKTYHDVKKTSTGTVYTKQSTPDGMSKGSGEDAAKAEEPVVKRGRGRPPGVGAKAGSYKPRDPAKKAASAAKAAASKAANRAMRKESFDLEFMESLIEDFEDEDFDDFIQSEEFENLDETTQESLISFINEKSCGSYKMKESLTGKQHKLDKNKNGKLDSHDFKLLRKEETEQIQESVNSYAAFLTKKQ